MIRSKYGRTGNFTSMVKYPFKKDEESTPKNIDLTTYRKLENCKGTILTSKLTFHEDYVFPTEFSELTEGGKDHWLALIHIDGNGMGNIIKDILKEGTADKLKEFSDNVDTATRAAFNTAMVNTFIQTYEKKEFKIDYRKMILPFRPLVLGGDDVTIIMRADFALNFTKIYLDEFEKNTQKANIQDGKGLTACAGIVYMKEKFPFHYAAHLAEELCGYAKDKSSRKASCLHFHKVQDSIYTDYKDIQKRELKASKIDFTTNPYYMDEQGNETTIDDLLTNTKKLFSDDAPRNKIREWVDACFNNPLMAEEIKKRISNFNNYIPKENETINYLTQLAITNYETKN
jgi:CRISPR/Cas system-associated protein Cas10 (large subunit of type III CRISPR-Cas system)